MKQDQASSTAKLIAASTILLASDPRTAPLVAPGAADLCRRMLSTNRADRLLAASAVHPISRAMWRLLEQLTHPGVMNHYWHRKRWIENRCRRAIDVKFDQIVIVGAGFDTLGIRIAREFPSLRVVEIDHPSTQNAKRTALADDPIEKLDNLQFVAVDLTREVLPARLLDEGAATLVIMEGLLMYFHPDNVDRLIASVRQLPVDRLRFIFSFMTRWPDGSACFRPRSWLIERWLTLRSEPFLWSLHPDEMAGFLAARQFRILELTRTRELPDGTMADDSQLDGENLVLCEPQ